MDKETFKKFYLYLRKEGLLDKNIPKLLKEETKFHEENISKQLYKDYSTFKNKFFENIVKNNPQHDKLLLFKKSQKFLDRILFVLFAEDKELIPTNAISKIVESWTFADDLHYKPLYELFTILFEHLNVGHIYKSGYEIPAYNGGLFAPDVVLDNLKVDDEVLNNDLLTLSKYDFNTDVDVNILGHIFEHSLSEIEEIEAELRGEEADKSKGKRKKDGVFYTPKYITKYIVDSTVGKLCSEKKEILGLDIDFDVQDYQKSNGSVNAKGKKLFQIIESYKEWLLQLKILDPACGSGAFLNQALTFLIEEHKNIDDLIAELTNSPLRIFDTDKAILENNIFGVDINDESVEIAKLSLWLRTAQKGRKLSNLNNNIKCGNSLIDDPAVAGDKAFNWEAEFPDIFAKGGFDVVIGNPPYLRVQGLRENFAKESIFYEKSFQSATGRFDIYVLFMEKSMSLIKDEGLISLILPHKFLISDFGEGIRKFFADNTYVDSIVHFGSEMVFDDASTYTCIIGLSKNNNQILYKQTHPNSVFDVSQFEEVSYDNLSGEKWNLKGKSTEAVFQNLKKQPQRVEDVFSAIRTGIDTGTDDIFIMIGNVKGDEFIGFSERIGDNIVLESSCVKPMLKGKDVRKYGVITHDHYVIYPHYENNGKTKPYEEDVFCAKFPKTYEYLSGFKDELTKKKIHKKTNPKYWYSLHRAREVSIFEQVKIITPETSLGGNLTIDNSKYYHNTQAYSLIKKDEVDEDYKYWLAIFNSSVFWFFLQQTGAVLRGGYFRFKTKYLEPFPLPNLKDIREQIPFIEKVDVMLNKTKLFQEEVTKIKDNLILSYGGIVLTKKLQKWYDLDYVEFIKELNKAIKKAGGEKLTKDDVIEWSSTFKKYKESALSIKSDINRTNKEIDRMVYELYDLTEEEIQIVENS